MFLSFLLQHNLLPYLAIIIMGTVIYFQFEKSIEQNLLIKEQEATIELTASNLAIIQTANEDRFKALEGVRHSKWKKGKHESSF